MTVYDMITIRLTWRLLQVQLHRGTVNLNLHRSGVKKDELISFFYLEHERCRCRGEVEALSHVSVRIIF